MVAGGFMNFPMCRADSLTIRNMVYGMMLIMQPPTHHRHANGLLTVPICSVGIPLRSKLLPLPQSMVFGFQTLTPADLDGQLLHPVGAPGIFMRMIDTEAHPTYAGAVDSRFS